MSMTRPRLKAPPGTTDTHIHIYDSRFPTAATATFTPPDASIADYEAVCELLGIERAVLVQATTYGTDNRCMLDAMAKMGRDRVRGVAIVDLSVTDQELKRLADAGICGIRFQMFPGGVVTWDMVEPLAWRVKPLGWHVILQFDGREFPKREAIIRRLADAVTVVLDHTGKFVEPVPVEHPAFQTMLGLMQAERFYAKVSGPYETSKVGPPGYEDVGALAAELIRVAPDRILWASNWPQVNPPGGIRPDNVRMLDLLLDWAPDEETRRKILVDNPARLYGF
ncbi:MAG TPA: amidohydrolase family protein [Pseudorhodoplanes sp.]|jgi:D-galactarolactone isomerase|nr:amidohydrolase family protein [Pseudorhodoplanes sp.]